MKEVRVVQMFVRFADQRAGLRGLVLLLTAQSAWPAQAASVGDAVDRAQDIAGHVVDEGFALVVWLMDEATRWAMRLNETITTALDRAGMDKQQAVLIGGSILIALFGLWLLPRGPRKELPALFDDGDDVSIMASAKQKRKRRAWRLRDAVDAMKAEMARDVQAERIDAE